MKRSTKQPTKTQIKKILASATFDPRKPGHMKPIVDVGRVEYYLARAQECIGSAQSHRNAFPLQDIGMAIALLALATAVTDNEQAARLGKLTPC